MKKDPLIFLKHILESIEKIEKFCIGVTKEDFLKDEKLQDAVVRRLEVIGEAAKNLSLSFRNKHPEIPWKEIAGMRDKLSHHYFGVNLETVWSALELDLPKLKDYINGIL